MSMPQFCEIKLSSFVSNKAGGFQTEATCFRVSKNPQIVKTQVFDDLRVSLYGGSLHNIKVLNKLTKKLTTQGVLTYCATQSCCGARCSPWQKPASPTDRCHSLRSLHLPPAALPSLPSRVSTYTSGSSCLSLRPL